MIEPEHDEYRDFVYSIVFIVGAVVLALGAWWLSGVVL